MLPSASNRPPSYPARLAAHRHAQRVARPGISKGIPTRKGTGAEAQRIVMARPKRSAAQADEAISQKARLLGASMLCRQMHLRHTSTKKHR